VSARLTSMDLPKWTVGALCAQVDPELFFPERGGTAPEIVRDALRVCAACEIRARCAEEALANHERFGVWGGMSERTRRRKLRETAAASVVAAGPTAAVVLGGEAA
jgi:WhiB family redox-sensing transcriptional regulator